METPDYYITYHKSQFKTPLEIIKKNFKNLQKLIDKQNYQINKINSEISNTTLKSNKIKLINKLIESQEHFNLKIKQRIKQHFESLNKLNLRLKRFHYIELLYKKYGSDIKKYKTLPPELDEFYNFENNLIVNEFLVFNKLPHSTVTNDFIDIEIINQGLKIKSEIENNKNLKILKLWCLENKKNLKLIKLNYPKLIKSDLEFECNFQEFIEFINLKKFGDAILFARKNFLNSESLENIEKISKGSSIIWSQFLINSIQKLKDMKNEKNSLFYLNSFSSIDFKNAKKLAFYYNHLTSINKWNDLANFFFLNFRLLYGMNKFSKFQSILNIGGSALHTKSCITIKEQSSDFNSYLNFQNHSMTNEYLKSECPICSIDLNKMLSKLPYSLQSKSNIFENQDPVILPNKNIYSFEKLLFFNRIQLQQVDDKCLLNISKFKSVDLNHNLIKNIKIFDPLTNEEFKLNDLEKVFPT